MSHTTGKHMFVVAAFAADGALEGTGEWRIDALSSEWLSIAHGLLTSNEPAFRTSFEGPLSHVSIQFTSVSGVAIGTMFVHGELAASMLLLRGEDHAAEAEVRSMWFTSVRKTVASGSEMPFEAATKLDQRPLMVVVPWGNPAVEDNDYELIRELALHIAGAYLCLMKG